MELNRYIRLENRDYPLLSGIWGGPKVMFCGNQPRLEPVKWPHGRPRAREAIGQALSRATFDTAFDWPVIVQT